MKDVLWHNTPTWSRLYWKISAWGQAWDRITKNLLSFVIYTAQSSQFKTQGSTTSAPFCFRFPIVTWTVIWLQFHWKNSSLKLNHFSARGSSFNVACTDTFYKWIAGGKRFYVQTITWSINTLPFFQVSAIPCFIWEMTSSTAINLWSWSLNFSSILTNPAE